MLTLLLCAFAHSVRTWAGDVAPPPDPSTSEKAAGTKLPASAFALVANPFALNTASDGQAPFARLTVPSLDALPASEFRPRKQNSDKPTAADYGSGDPMFRTTTVWQRLREFKEQDRVKVLTLWEMGGSNVSLQAGRKGDPWLQWSSSWTGRSRVSQGVLDRVLAASLSGMANRNHPSSRYPAASALPPSPIVTTPIPASK